jgi:3-hydroxyisobutyrate dehydrogenase
MTTVAVLGLGIMGSRIALNLLKAKLPVVVFNRTPARAEALLAAGALWASTPAEAARQAKVVISVVANDAASRELWLGEHGALDAMVKGTVAVECATLSPGWIETLHGEASRRGLRFVDAPLGGGKAMAEAATLSLFVGATPDDLEAARPVLSAFSASQLHFGPPGAGTRFKLVNNLFVAVQIAALGEALALAESLGLPKERVGEAWQNSGVTSGVAKAKLGFMLARDYSDTNFALQWMHKDVGYAFHAAQQAGFELPLGELAQRMYAAALERGLGDQDFAGVFEISRAA